MSILLIGGTRNLDLAGLSHLLCYDVTRNIEDPEWDARPSWPPLAICQIISPLTPLSLIAHAFEKLTLNKYVDKTIPCTLVFRLQPNPGKRIGAQG